MIYTEFKNITKKYAIIYADPPWQYTNTSSNGACENHYNTMKLEDICLLQVEKISQKDCVLFLWVTYPMLCKGLEVIHRWGFKYKTIAFQWVKLNKRNYRPFFGLGGWTRSNTEACFLATKGKIKRQSAKISQLIYSKRTKHSRKPPETRNKIIELMGDLPKIELFAREEIAGWDSWGNQVVPLEAKTNLFTYQDFHK